MRLEPHRFVEVANRLLMAFQLGQSIAAHEAQVLVAAHLEGSTEVIDRAGVVLLEQANWTSEASQRWIVGTSADRSIEILQCKVDVHGLHVQVGPQSVRRRIERVELERSSIVGQRLVGSVSISEELAACPQVRRVVRRKLDRLFQIGQGRLVVVSSSLNQTADAIRECGLWCKTNRFVGLAEGEVILVCPQ
jgi:hypothetical protein